MTDNSVSRKLAAILSADVVGFSRMMEADESGTLAALKAHRSDVVGFSRMMEADESGYTRQPTLAALKAHRSELFDPKIASYHGRMVKTTGEQNSIAVLPFENMSGDPEQEYFADGIAEGAVNLTKAGRS